ncbi:4772_t:CDS:2 [Acaulospora colombiana]|uniref:4772_t:CDS:1 n=1 Tax=Acaulospora colombiana TaxID=27376 RepID=A0ACA9NDG8_9GLOM|nr:4772_t:CDS:2 [Acaulospora colombiana]
MSTEASSQTKANGTPVKAPQFALSSRMATGRAMSLDVWSVFKYGTSCWSCLVMLTELVNSAANLPEDCINLGQGYMNFAPPQWVKDAADAALNTVAGNHYSHPKGRIRLREAVRDFYSKEFNRTLDVENEILISSGANEGQYSVWVAWLEPGDEVILFEPYFDQYLPSITFNHGVPVYVPLHPPPDFKNNPTSDEWKIDFDELRRAITPKTKMIVVNTPHNPIGKVFTEEELQKIADLAIEHNLIVMSDEVYDSLLFDGRPHVRIANLPGMWERTITVGSAGKSFACTGWRVGWLIGPQSLIGPTLAAQTRIVFCTNSPLQEAAACGLEQAEQRGYFKKQIEEYTERRDVLVKYFDELGLNYSLPYGSYFILVDVSKVEIPEDYPFPSTIIGRGRDF